MRRFIKGEDGVALGLAVILIVIVGVMGAGLLVFVRNDLEAVVQVNQGQEAFETAEAGTQAAKHHLLADACTTSYDGNPRGGDESCTESEWSYEVVSGENDDDPEPGMRLIYNGSEVDVKIKHLTPLGEGSCGADDTEDPECAPEETSDDRSFFEVEALGKSSNGEARRRIKAVYEIEPRAIPKTYLASRDIDIRGNSADIKDMSIFAGRDILNLRSDTLTGTDEVYGNWREPPWNTTPRPAGTSRAGAGAAREITYTSGEAARYGIYDFDKEGDSIPEFIEKDPSDGAQDADEISFPFKTGAVDDELLDFLCQTADGQDNYYTPSRGSFTIDDDNYPNPSDQTSVVCVEFTDDSKGSVSFKPSDRQGTMIVINGDLAPSSSAGTFKGVMVVDDPDPSDSTVPVYKDAGSFSLEGYVNVEGDIELKGSVSPSGSEDVANRPGFYNVRQWSWRELYE